GILSKISFKSKEFFSFFGLAGFVALAVMGDIGTTAIAINYRIRVNRILNTILGNKWFYN
ncbi:MAG TPA: hypothetical protein PLS71_20550, partial [Leptospiraceae bacterium]|nr:hypothetical protein [Leptospiraceae bacterium]